MIFSCSTAKERCNKAKAIEHGLIGTRYQDQLEKSIQTKYNNKYISIRSYINI